MPAATPHWSVRAVFVMGGFLNHCHVNRLRHLDQEDSRLPGTAAGEAEIISVFTPFPHDQLLHVGYPLSFFKI